MLTRNSEGRQCEAASLSQPDWDSLLQISEMDEMEAYRHPNELIRRVMQSSFYKTLLPACVDYYETPSYIFVHGWIPCFTEGYRPYVKYKYNPDWRNADVQDWRSARWFNGMEVACKHHITEPNKTIVCGHCHIFLWTLMLGIYRRDRGVKGSSGQVCD